MMREGVGGKMKKNNRGREGLGKWQRDEEMTARDVENRTLQIFF